MGAAASTYSAYNPEKVAASKRPLALSGYLGMANRVGPAGTAAERGG
jgi:hypothetical protein